MAQGTTSGRLPARVYWVRRAVVLGIPLLIVVVVLLALSRCGSEAPAPGPTTTGPTTTDAAQQPTPAAAGDEPAPTTTTTPTAAGGPVECVPPALTVAIVADAADVPAGVNPSFTVTITNTDEVACVVDAGEAFRQIVVVSGDDRVWASTDCVAADASPRTLLLGAGQSDATSVPWNRVRSAEGCPGGLPTPGAGTYSATVSLAGATSQPAVFVLH